MKKKKYKNFSVILSVYDGIENHLYQKALKSLLNQKYLPKKIIVVLDGVKKEKLIKETINFKNRYKKVSIIVNPKNLGIVKSYNKAINLAKTDIIAIQDSDDISLVNRFKKQYEYLKKNKKVSVVGSSVIEKNLDNGISVVKYAHRTHQKILKIIKYKNPMNHPTIMFRKKDILKCGGYLECNRMEDYYLWIRLINFGYYINNLDIPLVRMHIRKSFYFRRSGLSLLKSETKIQYELLKNGNNNIFYFIIILFVKCIYHLTPQIIKKNIRSFLITKFIK